MWKDDNDKIMELYDGLLSRNMEFPSVCPVCGEKEGHVHVHAYDELHGGIWMWCSACRSYAHMSGIIPTWWKNSVITTEDDLISEPTYLEEKKEDIDRWVNNVIFEK